MNAVLKLVASNGERVIDRNDEALAVLRDVRMEVYKHDPHVLAARVGVSVGTIMSFRSGRTIWPRPKTLFSILEAVGFKVTIVRKT